MHFAIYVLLIAYSIFIPQTILAQMEKSHVSNPCATAVQSHKEATTPPLFQAVLNEDQVSVKSLLIEGANPNLLFEKYLADGTYIRGTPLHFAVAINSYPIVKLFLHHSDTDIEIQGRFNDHYDITALNIVAVQTDVDIQTRQFIIDAFFEANVLQDIDIAGALMLAFVNRNTPIFQVLHVNAQAYSRDINIDNMFLVLADSFSEFPIFTLRSFCYYCWLRWRLSN